MRPLDFHVFAGEDALQHIRQNGLSMDDVHMLVGASSGPKWLALHGFDQYLITQFQSRTQPLHLIGTSAGAWRMSCYAQQNVLAAHQRLTQTYLNQRYSARPSGAEILQQCRKMVRDTLGESGVDEILNHPTQRYHLITTQCHGLAKAQSRGLQGAVFAVAMLGNFFSRYALNVHFTRVVMEHPNANVPLPYLPHVKSRTAKLSADKLEDAVLSTGCIPVLIQGVRDVAGKGIYQDGGITDYGFDLPFKPESGFTLYPHFHKRPAPGWFDKNLKWRKPNKRNYARTIMLVPTDEFVSTLPCGRIPDRKDFERFDDDTRIRNWTDVVNRTAVFKEQLDGIDWAAAAQPLPW